MIEFRLIGSRGRLLFEFLFQIWFSLTDASAIQTVTPSDVFGCAGIDVHLTMQSERTEIENNWYALTGHVVALIVEADGDSDPCGDAESGQNLVGLSSQFASGMKSRFESQKRSQLLICMHSETLPVAAMRVSNPDRSPSLSSNIAVSVNLPTCRVFRQTSLYLRQK
jgi:hypothetical protein